MIRPGHDSLVFATRTLTFRRHLPPSPVLPPSLLSPSLALFSVLPQKLGVLVFGIRDSTNRNNDRIHSSPSPWARHGRPHKQTRSTPAFLQSMPETQPGAGLPRSGLGEGGAGRFQAMVQARQGRRRREPAPQDGELSRDTAV